jgi:hypothetical protein
MSRINVSARALHVPADTVIHISVLTEKFINELLTRDARILL